MTPQPPPPPHAFSLALHRPLFLSAVVVVSLGLWVPVRDPHLAVLPGGGHCGALYEENLLQAAAALLHSPGHWHTLLQRLVSAHPRGSVISVT